MRSSKIVGFPNYEIVENGTVLNGSGKPLRTFPHRRGYAVVWLYKDGMKFQKYVHRLLALSFLERPQGASEVNHINGVKDDNRLENLEWVSHSQNLMHAHAMGLVTQARGSLHPQAVLSSQAVNELLEQRRMGLSITELANKFGISRTTVFNVISGATYAQQTGIGHEAENAIGKELSELGFKATQEVEKHVLGESLGQS